MSDLADAEFEYEENTAYVAKAGPWQRFWSRSLDIAIWAWPVGYVVGRLFPDIALRLLSWDSKGYLFGLALLPVILIIDAMSLALFGNTVGRAVAGIRVATVRHEKLEFFVALKRNFNIYVAGLGLGIPIVALFTQISNYRKITNGENTSWDKYFYTRVYSESGNAVRTTICAVLVILAIVIPKAVEISEQEEARANQTTQTSATLPYDDPVARQLKEAAASVQPQMLDPITRVDGAESDGRTFIYNYTVTRRDVSDEQFADFFNKSIKTKVCADQRMRVLLKDYGVTYRYVYNMPNASKPLIYMKSTGPIARCSNS